LIKNYSPIIIISVCITFPNFSLIISLVYLINLIISSAVALLLFIIKPACLVEISAPPILYPLSPASSINFAVIKSSPLLNVLPALGLSSG